MPNVITESQRLKMIELDNAARAVGVAVQSKLYGLKNAATVSEGSYYSFLNDGVAAETDIHLTSQQDDDAAEAVKYITNFEETKDKRGALGKRFFFSGFLTDTELLERGYIVLFYKPATGDVVEVFYSEKPIALRGEGRDAGLIDFLEQNAISQEYLELNKIGHYFGYGVEEPVRLNGMPLFTCNWVWDDELRLEIEMLTQPAEELLDVPLGLELYLEFPALDGSEKSTEEMMIYAEGIFDSQYDATKAKNGYVTGLSAVISPDTPLTLREIQNHGGLLNFALDSLVMSSVPDSWDGGYYKVKERLYKQNYPKIVSVVEQGVKFQDEKLLYPRESINYWLDYTQNPFITVWYRRHATGTTPNEGDDTVTQALCDIFKRYVIASQSNDTASRTPTNFVKVDERITLRAELFTLETDESGTVVTQPDSVNGASLRKRAEEGPSVTLRSHRIAPYYYLLSEDNEAISLSSIRDLSNLHYVFDGAENTVNTAKLAGDITGDAFYNKLINIRKKLCEQGYIGYQKYADPETNKRQDQSSQGMPWETTDDRRWLDYPKYREWGSTLLVWDIYRINEVLGVRAIDLWKPFTIDGAKPGGGSYKIQNITFLGRQGGDNFADPAGLFEFARGCVFKNLDIVNPRIWRRRFDASCLQSSDGKKITGIDVSTTGSVYDSAFHGGPGGGLVAFAVNCEFTNIRVYLQDDDEISPLPNSNLNTCRIDSSIIGGIVGVAIGDPNAETGENATAGRAIQNTTFTNCAASIFLINAAYDPAACVVYAGGLVGIAMGDVTIQNSYAASMLSAYYAGGLVGATVSDATWKFAGGTYLGVPFTGEGKVSKAPTIQNSFSAGLIERQVRVGAGLIADLQGTAPQVSGCYSASWWEAISPVAYGTFKGDKQNYYVYQTRFAVPVTSNVEAWFAAEGDVLSLQSGDHGIACTGGDLAEKLKNAGWTAAPTLEKTHQWSPGNGHERYRESSNEYPGWPNAWNGHGKPEPYPFPMPEGNAEFWGDWIRNGTYVKETTGTGAIPKFSVKKFMDYFCTYYQSSDGGNLRNDVTQIASRDDYANIAIRRYGSLSRDYAGSCELRRRRFQIQGNNVTLTTNTTVDQHEDRDWVLSSDGTGLDALEYWWAEGANPNGSLAATNWGNPETQKRGYNVGGSRKVPGDVVGVTNASGNNGNFVFTAPKFYDPDFNPIKDYTFALEEGKIVLRHTKDGKNIDDLLFAGVSYGNLSVTALKFQRADAAISIEIAVFFGAKELWRGDAGVKPLNGLSE